jgi:hypothetical protein
LAARKLQQNKIVVVACKLVGFILAIARLRATRCLGFTASTGGRAIGEELS